MPDTVTISEEEREVLLIELESHKRLRDGHTLAITALQKKLGLETRNRAERRAEKQGT